MDERRVRQIIREELGRTTDKARFDLKSIPRHVHDGVDSLQISEDDVLLTKKLISQLILDASETFTLRNVYNVSRISFHGIAFDSSNSPSQAKSSISGEAIFGQCNQFVGQGSSIAVVTAGNPTAFVQASNSMFIDTTDLTNAAVTSSPNLAYAGGATAGVDFVTLTLDSYQGDSLQFTATLAENWVLNGILIIE